MHITDLINSSFILNCMSCSLNIQNILFVVWQLLLSGYIINQLSFSDVFKMGFWPQGISRFNRSTIYLPTNFLGAEIPCQYLSCHQSSYIAGQDLGKCCYKITASVSDGCDITKADARIFLIKLTYLSPIRDSNILTLCWEIQM